MKVTASWKTVYPLFFTAAALAAVWGASNCGTDINQLLDGGLDGGRVCTTSAQCKATEVCKNHICVPAGTCSKKADCAEDEDCVGGRCTAGGGDGGPDDDGGGSDGGQGDGGAVCSGDGECPAGNRCNLATRACEPAAIISVEPADTLDFGAVPYGQETRLSFAVTNKGKLVLDVTGFEIQNPPGNDCFRVTGGGASVKLAEGESRSVEVAYKQNGPNADTGKAIIASTDPVRPVYQLNLRSSYKGRPKFSVFTRDPLSGAWVKDYPRTGSGYQYPLDFGYVSQGSLKHKVLQFKNITDGDAILVLKDFSALNTPKNKFVVTFMDGPDADSAKALSTPVQADPSTHVFLGAGESAYLHVDYDAKNKEQDDGQDFHLATNDNDINGSGNPGTSAITVSMTARSKASKIEVSPLALDFGKVQKGTSSKLTVTISNSGDSDLKIAATSGIKFQTGTLYSTNPASLEKTVPAKGDFPVDVVFSPASVSSENNVLVINSDDADLPVVEVTLAGTGTDPTLLVTTTPQTTGTPPEMDFGKVLTGTKSTGAVTVKNTGFGDLLISEIALNQAAGGPFAITGMKLNGAAKTLPATLREQGADTLTFSIDFEPAVTGVMNASIVFRNSDAKNQDYTINLVGTSQYNKGLPCQYDADCSTGFCSDSVCCEARCGDKCMSCNQDGYKGVCRTVSNGAEDPRGVCKAAAYSTCGQTGNCVAGDCQIWPGTTLCAAAACIDGNLRLKPARYCSGDENQSCVDSTPVQCSPYICDGALAPAACKTACLSNFDCVPGYSCDTADNKCKLVIGQQCQTGGECASGFCADGVCCRDKCDQPCEACNLGANVGDCTAAGKGDPDPRGKCEMKDASTCKTNGNCSGTRGACAYWGTSTVCEEAKCSTDRRTSYSSRKCDGLGACGSPSEVLCAPYSCDTSAGICNSSCTSNDNCASNALCEIPSGQQVGTCKLVTGTACNSDAVCFSGFCTDNVCCNDRCNMACEKCNLAGSVGVCSAVASGQGDPRQQCATQSEASCGYNGLCSGARGACQKWGVTTACLSPTCTDDILNLTHYCSGNGICLEGGTQNCVPYTCRNGACLSSCTSSVDCAADYSCNTVTQKCLKDDGQGCSADAECYHGFCTDGYCCNARCNGACESCRLTGKHGYCDPVAAGGDPDNECELQDPSTCGRTGYCSGNRSCQLYQDGTVCEAATCSGNISNLPHKCNGLGNCAEGGTQACLPYVCNGATGLCKTSCTLSTDCQTNYTCDTASLTCKKNDGQSCGTDAECYHGFCTDSVCCASRCNGTCESCNQAGRAGYCDPVPANTDPQGECDWSNPATCGLDGFCSGSRSCRLWGTDTVCDTASCNGSMVVREKKCDGAEHCATQTPATLDCGAYLCNPITRGCYTDCSGGFECAPGSACAADKTCRKQAGAACQSDAECASGFCTDNTCCADRCHGKCEKCNMQGRAGFCDPVASELDPDSECEDQGAASCGTIGYCSGQRSCALYPAGTVCSQSYCSGNTLYRNDACNGNGFCTDGGEQNCIPYACDTATKTCKNCVGCLQGNSDCNEACRRSGKPGGYCIDSESTDPSRCCICYPDTGCENCLPPGQPSCWAACRAMGAQAGWCGNPGSVDPTNCCACLW